MPTPSEQPVDVWAIIQQDATRMVGQEPLLAAFGCAVILGNTRMSDALCHILSRHQSESTVGVPEYRALLLSIYTRAVELGQRAAADLQAIVERDPAAPDYLIPFLYYKGFHALQSYRASHWLWQQGRRDLACYIQNRSSMIYGVDIHPAAQIGKGVMLDHATGIVIGETAVVEDHVSILHGVTLGGTGKEKGDRHPKIRKGVLIGAGATILGNIEVGEGAQIAAGSMVLSPVAPHTVVAGVPAHAIGSTRTAVPSEEMDQTLPV